MILEAMAFVGGISAWEAANRWFRRRQRKKTPHVIGELVMPAPDDPRWEGVALTCNSTCCRYVRGFILGSVVVHGETKAVVSGFSIKDSDYYARAVCRAQIQRRALEAIGV